MEFPILDLIGHNESTAWVEQHFHPNGLKCPNCGAGKEQGRVFRQTRKSRLTVYRCQCGQTDNSYTGTGLEQHHRTPAQVVLLLWGIVKGETTAALSRKLGIGYEAVLTLRTSYKRKPNGATERDEMFQNAREKGTPHRDLADPPRRRANKRRGRGTDANDRPPIVGVDRNTDQVPVRVKLDTKAKPLWTCPGLYLSWHRPLH